MSITSMNCEMCLAEIPAETGKCPYCGAEYRVKISGYCAGCHAVRAAGADGDCKQCGGAVMDLQVESQRVRQVPAASPGLPVAAAQQDALSAPGLQPGRYLANLLRPGEKVLYRTRLHGITLLGAAFSLLLGLVIYFYFDWVGELPASLADPSIREGTVREVYATGYWVIMAVAVLFGVAALRVLLTFIGSEVLITSRRVLGRYSGFFSRLVEVELTDIIRVNASRAMLVDQGTVSILSASRKTVVLPNLPHPHQFRSELEGLLPPNRPQLARPNWGRAVFVVLGLLAVIAGVVFLAVNLAPESPASRQPVEKTPSSAPALDTLTASLPTPTPRPVAQIEALPDNGACVGSTRGGIVCLGPQGWEIPAGSLADWENPTEMAVCLDGRVLVLASDGLFAYRDGEWLNYGRGDFYLSDDLACGADGKAWVLHLNGASAYSDGGWTDYRKEDIFGAGTKTGIEQGVAAGPDGSVWLAYSSGLAVFDGNGWQGFTSGQGLPEDHLIEDIGVDSQGRAWALHDSGVLLREGDGWKEIPLPGTASGRTLTIDSQDRVWVGTGKNMHLYANGSWKTYDVARGLKSGSDIRKVFVDSQDRVWIGTDWGLNVLAGNTWTTYHMHTSGLEDNNVDQIVVWGAGPELPALEEKPAGSLEGRLTVNGQPVKDLRVEVCMASMGTMFAGSTPCAGEPFQFISLTDAEGRFRFDDLPTGYYSVTFRTPGGNWKILSSAITIGGKMVLVEPGKTHTLETLDIEE